ncbi:hypothetical protein GGI25_003940 [Coemansia spiralis]|uniref:RRM domain-containing protein n=2 Tax=Coemansia TaxID=4863 RepID=A0A9W8G7K4_9FUNG|nr:hypothetical protein BX070DRAFT_229792 [Coemansia spiralis]KAJ1986066.1 hypothetical protein EDC05_006429 [Coemansia umbellata]KAJ2620952.1 hypothetical protein GGI26_004558 [Coemansia sp. RSA 1358]KAJ2675523.1 hypothetical protein GGI25_003940 [Coemansia spiralis]
MASSYHRQGEQQHQQQHQHSRAPPPPHISQFQHQPYSVNMAQPTLGSNLPPMGMHPPPYMQPVMSLPYATPPARAPPKIRHPNRPPCTIPSKTLYIRNLREKTKDSALIKALRALFETYGEIIEVRARHSIRMRGQAFIVFKNKEDAIKAHQEVQGFMLFGKPMFIEFSRAPSDATIADEGGDTEEFKQQRLVEKEQREREARDRIAQATASAAALAVSEAELPNKILFLQGLPADIAVPEIESTFSAYAGFVEVRWVSVKPEVAFVEYENEVQAGIARSSIGPQWVVREGLSPVAVSFAKR